MAGNFSDYSEAKLLNHVFGGTTWATLATLYVGLFTADPTDAGGGTEATGGSYARVAVTNNTTNFPNATGTAPTSKTTGADITFPTATASWGTVSSYGIFDASSAGNLLWWTTLTNNKTIGNGDTAKISTGAITMTLD